MKCLAACSRVCFSAANSFALDFSCAPEGWVRTADHTPFPIPQAAMRAAEAESTEECPVKMKLVAPPLYVLNTQTLDKAKGIEVLNKATDAVKASIEGNKGRLVVKEGARAVSERDDRLLNETLTALENANKEVAGDSDSEEDDEGMGDVDVESGGGLVV